jgi:hypothetical protein
MELCYNAGGVEACFGDEFVRGVDAECEEGGEGSDGGCVGGAGAAHNDGKDVNSSTWPVTAESVVERGVFVSDELCGVREVTIGAVFAFHKLNLSN